jgi:hypothetical protein
LVSEVFAAAAATWKGSLTATASGDGLGGGGLETSQPVHRHDLDPGPELLTLGGESFTQAIPSRSSVGRP